MSLLYIPVERTVLSSFRIEQSEMLGCRHHLVISYMFLPISFSGRNDKSRNVTALCFIMILIFPAEGKVHLSPRSVCWQGRVNKMFITKLASELKVM